MLARLIVSSFFFFSVNTFAYTHSTTGTGPSLGDLAHNIVGAELALNSFIHFLCVMGGIGLLAASVYQFKFWWGNRAQRAFTRPVLFLILGLCLLGIAFIPPHIEHLK